MLLMKITVHRALRGLHPNLATLQGFVNIISELLRGDITSNLCHYFLNPPQNFLICKAMKGTSQAIDSSSKGEIWV
jgi:hypothetical protein